MHFNFLLQKKDFYLFNIEYCLLKDKKLIIKLNKYKIIN